MILKCKQPPDIEIIPGIILYLAAYYTFARPFAAASAGISVFCIMRSYCIKIKYKSTKQTMQMRKIPQTVLLAVACFSAFCFS